MTFSTLNLSKKSSLLLILTCFLLSVITGFSASAIFSTNGNISTFFNLGDSCSYTTGLLRLCSVSIPYDIESNLFTITNNHATFTLQLSTSNSSWNYCKIEINDISCESILITCVYSDNNTVLGTDTFTLENGINMLNLSTNSFQNLQICFENYLGTSFCLESVELSVINNADYDPSILLTHGTVISAICMVVLLLILFMFRKKIAYLNYYRPIDALQNLYIAFGNFLYERLPPLSARIKSILRILLLTVMFIILSFVNVYNLFFNSAFHKYIMLFILICLFLAVILYIEKPLAIQNWKNPFVLSWLILWCMACVSDFIVPKSTYYFRNFYGYFILFILGFLFFVWSNNDKHTSVFRELCKVVELTFLLCTIYCLFFRPLTGSARYNGFYNNPNPFGLYLAIVGCAFLCELDLYIKKHYSNILPLLAYCTSLCAVIFFLRISGCFTAILAFGSALLLWICRNIRHSFVFGSRKRFFIALSLTLLCYIPVSFLLQWGLSTLPYIFRTQITYPSDLSLAYPEWIPFQNTITVYAQETNFLTPVNRVLLKLSNLRSLDILLSGRTLHYRTYLRAMNLFGHAKSAYVYGSGINYPHNGFLAYAYAYGVYALIPYIIMNLCYCYNAFRYMTHNLKNGYSFFPFSIFLVFFLENMSDNVDTPFHWIVWYIFVFVGGLLFSRQEEK